MPDETPEALFKRWLYEYGGAVLKVARAYTLTAEDCQDLAQEILLQVWRSLPQFQGRASASTWMRRPFGERMEPPSRPRCGATP